MTEVTLEIPYPGQAGADRLDRWLAQQYPELSRARLQRLIEAGQVWLNGMICQEKQHKLQTGDQIRLTIPPAQPLALTAQAIPLDILYEDEHLIILNKPAGLVVHPAPGHPDGTLVNGLLAHCPDLQGIGGIQRPGIVHRLDKDTSGAMVVAKTDRALQSLQAELKAKMARRRYFGVLYGVPGAKAASVSLPLGRHPIDRVKMGVVRPEKGGREAITHWQVLERLGNLTLLQYDLETGRTHQIRVHSKEIGHPLVGDPLYGNGRSWGVNLPGQALHAHQLSFIHPLSQQEITAVAPLPSHFEKLLTFLRQRC